MSPPRLELVVAASENDVIGRDGDLPWRLPADLRHFKRLTMGHTIVMGRKTWESIGRALPGRHSVVVTRDPAYPLPDGVERVADFTAVLADRAEDVLFIIGGGDIYRQALPHASVVHLTRVHAEVDGDVTFPSLERPWRRIDAEHHPVDAKHTLPFTFETWRRA
ncbi:MAG: dihydrofolate reductase [Acidobacteriota bacterium]